MVVRASSSRPVRSLAVAVMIVVCGVSGDIRAQDPASTGAPEESQISRIVEGAVGEVAADPYIPREDVQGDLYIAGSQTMQQMAALWSDRFQELHPGVKCQVDCHGSEGALPALAKGNAAIVAVSRLLTADEKVSLEKELSRSVIQIIVAWDVMGVIVHPDNPAKGLQFVPGKGILSQVENGRSVKHWGDLGLTDEWAELPLTVFGPGVGHGTRNWIDGILRGAGLEAVQMKEVGTRDEVIRMVASERGSLGLVSLVHGGLEKVRVLPIADGDLVVRRPTEAEIFKREYPLIRPLTLVVAESDGGAGGVLAEEFLAYVLSHSGQEDVVKDGFYPLNRSEWRVQHQKPGANQER